MLKRGIHLLLALWIAFFISHSTKAQSYSIRSLDGKKADITLSYKSFSKQLTLSCLKDTMYLDNYLDTEQVCLLADKFLQITYNVRGGTGLELQNTAIISVIDNKIKLSMLVQSYAYGFSPEPGNTDTVDKEWHYTLKFSAMRSEKYSCKLIVDIHQQQKSKLHPQSNYSKSQQTVLNFDLKRNIFYHQYNDVSRSFMIVDDITRKMSSKYVKELLPMITLRDNKYYYIKDGWYSTGFEGRLYKEYSR